jgi:hypothetical protein
MNRMMDRRALPLVLWALCLAAQPARAQWVRENEQHYLPTGHDWVFRRTFPQADRLFNAFDYGHAILYEKLYTRPGAPASILEEDEYGFITRKLLVSPPRLPLAEAAIEVEYAKLAPETKLMFDWAHLLHRQIYDVLGDPGLTREEQDRAVAELLRHYKTRPDLAFSSLPKSMELMEGQYYSTAFRKGYPKFNGLIWAYHWLQVGLYEPLLTGTTAEERQAGVTAAVTRFRQMLVGAPEKMPRVMPMTAAIAPEFTRRYPEAAIIFDNLHSMHDVVSDILASDSVPRARKREEIVRAAARYRDATSFVETREEWLEMAQMMGANNMGGPVTGFLAAFPSPTLPRGAVMAGMENGTMPGMPGMTMDSTPHDAMPGMPGMPAQGAAGEERRLREMQARMMADPVIRERVATDPVLQRMMAEVGQGSGEAASSMAGMPGMGAAPADVGPALDFIVRLLADPQVESRVQSDPALRRLWSDPEVQRRVREIRARPASAPAADHQH